MKRSHRLRVPAIAVVAMGALAVAACSSGSSSSPSSGAGAGTNTNAALTASAPGITPTTITIGSHQPLTGPAAPGYSEIAPAAAAYFAYVNAQGGVRWLLGFLGISSARTWRTASVPDARPPAGDAPASQHEALLTRGGDPPEPHKKEGTQ